MLDYEELERRILTRLGVDPAEIPSTVTYCGDKQEYTLAYCIVQALVEYDKMRYESGLNQKGDVAARDKEEWQAEVPEPCRP